MPEKPDRKDIAQELPPEAAKKAGSENAVTDERGQKNWSNANAASHFEDKTPSRLDMKTANSPLELVDHTETGSQRVLVSSAERAAENSRASTATEKLPLTPVTRADLERFSQNDFMAAGLLRDLDSATQISDASARAERETQVLKIATQTYGKAEKPYETVMRTVDPTERKSSQEIFDTQQIKALIETDETARATNEMLDALSATQLSPTEKERLRTELKSSFTEMHDSAESLPRRMENGMFSLGATVDVPPQNSNQQLADKLGHFAEALYKNAVKEITDPKIQAQYWQAQEEKIIGIGLGLNDAKESMKVAAAAAFNAIADGSAANFLLNPKTYEPLALAAEVALQKMAENPNATNEAFAAAMNSIGAKTAQMSEAYSKMTPQEQGRVIGNVMFAFINPEGSLEAPQLLGKAGARSQAAVAESFAAVMKSGTAEEIVQNLKLIRDMAKSPEMHQWSSSIGSK